MTSLADMTPMQRLRCIGMWCDVDTEEAPAILVEFFWEESSSVRLFAPSISDLYTMRSLDAVTPLPDLPRAWRADGNPVM